ncbi:MAG TPA: lipase family protein [Caulobacteraceae bacterium]|jgi:hypothetical protein
MTLTLTGRLLCAAQQTYQISVSGPAPVSPPQPAPPPSSLVGWLGVPQCAAVGDDKINAVMVGETAGEVIVAYRGTEPFTSLDHERMVLDWLDDMCVPLVNSPYVQGSIHAGFSHAVDELWSWVLEQLKDMPTSKPLWVVGHSKGGAMANIAALKLAAGQGRTPYVCTFEAARAGDPAFAADFADKVKHAVRYEYQDDIVPWLPPTDTLLPFFKQLPIAQYLLSLFIPSYQPVGDLRFIDWQDNIVGDSVALEAQRCAHLIAELEKLNCGQVMDDHSIGPGSGVAAVLCPGVWPAPLIPPAVAVVVAEAAGPLASGVPF